MQKLMAYRRYVRERRIVQLASAPYRPPETRKDYDPWDPDYGKQRARDRVMRKYWDDQEALTPAELKEVEDWVNNLPTLSSQSGGRRSSKVNPANARIARWARASYASNGKGKAKGGKARSGGMSTGSAVAAAAPQGGGASPGGA